MLRTGATLAVRSLLALLAVCCCVASALAQDGKTYWQVHTGGGAAMSLEGGRLLFAEQIGRVAVGTEYFSGERSGRIIRGLFAYSMTEVSRCPPIYSGELILSEDGRSFTLTTAALPNTQRVSGCSASRPNSTVIRGEQIHWPSRAMVAAVVPRVIAQVPDVVPPAKPVEKIAQPAPPVLAQSNTLAVAPERTEPMFAVLLLVVVACWLVFGKSTVPRFMARLTVRLARWLAMTGAVVAVLLAPIYWLGQNRELIATEGTFFHWIHYNVSIPVATALNKAAPYCGTTLLSSPAGATTYSTFENVLPPPHWPRCQASLTALAVSAQGWSGWSATGQWLSGVWQWLSTNSGGVLPWFGWLFGTIWAWVSAPFVWVLSSISDALWWLATPFVQFFWLVYTIIYWLLWLVVQIVIWFVWIVWTLAVWLVWLLGQALYYLAMALKWFAINLGNYVIAIGLVAGAFFALAMRRDNPLSKWVNDYVARHKPQPRAQQNSNNQHKPNTPPPPDNKLAEYMNALDVLGVKDKVGFLKEDDVRARYRQLSKQTHPDHGGSSRMQADVNAAWLIVCAKHGWRK